MQAFFTTHADAAENKANQSEIAQTPSARVIAPLLTTERDDLEKSEAILVAAIEVDVSQNGPVSTREI